ncbi:MAG: MBL fold metallo-hydrolase [Alphaproteobacteria bacterium]
MPANETSSLLEYFILPVTPLQQNCTLVWNKETLQGAVIDPGGDVPIILAKIKALGLNIEKILVTHGHADHAGGVAALKAALDVPIIGPHKADQFWIDRIESDGMMFGIGKCDFFTPDRWLEDGDQVEVGGMCFDVIHCPGHTPGHVVFYHAPSQFIQLGDVLFCGSIGRTDFPRGNHDDLLHAIRHKLFPLGSETRFVPGHGPMSDFGHERKTNPFVADHLFPA